MALTAGKFRGIFLQARLHGVGTPGRKGAPLGLGIQIGRRAGNGVQLTLHVLDQVGHGPQKPPGIGVAGAVKYLPRVAVLHDLARIHHGDPVGHLGHYAQIMGNEQYGGPSLLLQVVHQIQDLRLHRHVQGGGGLVGKENLGIAGHSHGNHDPLTLTTGHGMGVALCHQLRVGQAHLPQQLCRNLLGLLAGHPLMAQNTLAHLPSHPHGWVQAGHRILKNHGKFLAPVGLHSFVAQMGDVGALVGDGARLDLGWRGGQQLHNGLDGHRLAAAGLAHNAQRLTRIQPEADAPYRLDFAGVGVKGDMQVLHVQKMVRHKAPPLVPQMGVQRIAQTVAEQIKCQNGHTDKHAGNKQLVGVEEVKLRAHLAQLTPGRHGGFDAQADKAQVCLQENGRRDGRGDVDHLLAQDIGQDVPENNADGGGPQSAGSQDKLPVFKLEHPAPDDAGRVHPTGNGNSDDDGHGARVQPEHNQGHIHQRWDAHAHVNDAHDEHIHPAAEKAGQAAQKDADDLGHNGAAQTDNQGDPCPHPDPGPQIPASGIGAEPVLGTGRLVGVEQIGGLIAVRRKYGGKNGHQDDDDKEGQTDYGDFVGPNTAQHVPPVADTGAHYGVGHASVSGQTDKILLGQRGSGFVH